MILFFYKNYTGKILLDSNTKIQTGKVIFIKDSVTFEGETCEELYKAFKDSVDSYLEFCEELNQEPNPPNCFYKLECANPVTYLKNHAE